MECEHAHNVEESTVRTESGIIMKINLAEHEEVSHFRSLQFDFVDEPSQKEYSGNEVIKHVAI
jgi:hypothetical protein